MSNWILVVLLGLQAHFAASYIVPLDKESRLPSTACCAGREHLLVLWVGVVEVTYIGAQHRAEVCVGGVDFRPWSRREPEPRRRQEAV